MRNREDAVLAFIEREGGDNLDHFTLQVDLEFVEENNNFEIAEIRTALENILKKTMNVDNFQIVN